tara:strand:+ start:197 stop:1795 length:1599 start_codon:yes stop_codon:yes gene_type:complete
MKNLQISIGIIIALAFTSFIIGGNETNESSSNTKPLETINTSLTAEEIFIKKHPKRELRSAWITTFTNLDWPSTKGLTSLQQKKEFLNIVSDFQNNSINAVIGQIRASSDAFYKSKLSPWSEWLTGQQGEAPDSDFDPLKFMVDECHKRNMEFHAWFNPFRAVSHVKFSSISNDHITRKKPEWFFKYGNTLYYNPGIPEVRKYICNVVKEVVQNYDIDGVHFDDYFYPYTIKGEKIPDDKEFNLYSRGCESKEDWRRDNINLLIQEVAQVIKIEKKHVKFGVSPLAIWRNHKQDPKGSFTNSGQSSYDNLYCDTKLWIEESWVDYMAPQLYWSTSNKFANYNHLINWWTKNEYNRHLYVGHAIYKLDTQNRHSFETEELIKQVNIARQNGKVNGNIYFRAKAFVSNHQNFQKTISESIYKYPSLIPAMTWIDSISPSKPTKLKAKINEGKISLRWKSPKYNYSNDSAAYFVVYRFEEGEIISTKFPNKIVSIQKNNEFTDTTATINKKYRYAVTAVDRLHNESKDFAYTEVK